MSSSVRSTDTPALTVSMSSSYSTMLRGSCTVRIFSSARLTSFGCERTSSVLSSSSTRHSMACPTGLPSESVSVREMPSPSYSSTFTCPLTHSMSMERKPFSCTTSPFPAV